MNYIWTTATPKKRQAEFSWKLIVESAFPWIWNTYFMLLGLSPISSNKEVRMTCLTEVDLEMRLIPPNKSYGAKPSYRRNTAFSFILILTAICYIQYHSDFAEADPRQTPQLLTCNILVILTKNSPIRSPFGPYYITSYVNERAIICVAISSNQPLWPDPYPWLHCGFWRLAGWLCVLYVTSFYQALNVTLLLALIYQAWLDFSYTCIW